ncbi:hypothetical protein EZS27_044177, partial [termite gut metagenome]
LVLNRLHCYPFLRILIPFTIGIVIGDYLFFHSQHVWLQPFALFFICSALFLPASYLFKKYSLRWLFGISVYICLFSAGISLTSWQLQQTSYTFPPSESVYRAVITDKPEIKERTVLCRTRLLESRHLSSVVFPRKNILLYLPKDSTSISLQNGNEILFSALLSPPRNNYHLG